jgi:hypothetical protein
MMGEWWFWVLYAFGAVVVFAVLLPLVESLDFWLGDRWQRWRQQRQDARLDALTTEKEQTDE